jgi:hypothetical protein
VAFGICRSPVAEVGDCLAHSTAPSAVAVTEGRPDARHIIAIKTTDDHGHRFDWRGGFQGRYAFLK